MRILSEVSKRQDKYDAETDHGRRQPRMRDKPLRRRLISLFPLPR